MGRIIFINLHYVPDVAATGQYVADLATFLAGKGHEVAVWSGSAHYKGNTDAPAHEHLNGVEVSRFPGTAFGRGTVAGRLLDYLSYFVSVAWSLVFNGKAGDIYVSLTTPPLISVLTQLLRKRQSRHIIWIMDLHPEAEAAVGMVTPDGLLFQMMKAMMQYAYKKADTLVALGPEMKNRLLGGYHVNREKIRVIPVWGTDEGTAASPAEARKRLWPEVPQDAFVVNYSGNLGLVHDAETLFEVVTSLAGSGILFTFSGDGPRRVWLENSCREAGLDHVFFKGYIDRKDVPVLHRHAQVNWLSLREDCGGIAVPSKLIAYMAASIPVVFIGPKASDPAVWITEAACGMSFRNGDITGISGGLQMLASDADAARAMGENARRFYEALFSGNCLIEEWVALTA